MLGQFWAGVRIYVELLKQYRAAVVTAEALVWHHGYKGLDAALSAAETPADDLRAIPRLGHTTFASAYWRSHGGSVRRRVFSYPQGGRVFESRVKECVKGILPPENHMIT